MKTELRRTILVACTIILVIAVSMVIAVVQQKPKPPTGTLTFIMNSAPADATLSLRVSSFDENGNTGLDYWITRGEFAYTKDIRVTSETVNVTIFAHSAAPVPLVELGCLVFWRPDGGTEERYEQYDIRDSILVPKCDWRRGYPNEQMSS